jgi:hypothetical protein
MKIEREREINSIIAFDGHHTHSHWESSTKLPNPEITTHIPHVSKTRKTKCDLHLWQRTLETRQKGIL